MALCQDQETGIRLESVDVYFGKSQCRTFTFDADASTDTNSEYFELNVVGADFKEKKGYVWFNVDSTGVDPGITDKAFSVEVPYAEDADGATRAEAVRVALEASGELVQVAVDGAVLEVMNKVLGAVSTETQSASSKVTAAVGRVGIGGNLGYIQEGGSEMSLETQSVEIRADQTGQIILDDIMTGNSAVFSTGFIQTDQAKLEALIGSASGDVYEPVGGSKLVGFGESRLFKSLKALGGMLVLHPRRLPLTDHSEDWVFWKSAFLPASLNFSGSDVAVLAGEFKGYLDSQIADEINLISRGDWTQDVKA